MSTRDWQERQREKGHCISCGKHHGRTNPKTGMYMVRCLACIRRRRDAYRPKTAARPASVQPSDGASTTIYAVLAYGVARLTPEIGIRRALGATSASILQMVMRQGLRPRRRARLTWCRVSLSGLDGRSHQIEVRAESMHKAAVIGLRSFKRASWSSGRTARVEITLIEPPGRRSVTDRQHGG